MQKLDHTQKIPLSRGKGGEAAKGVAKNEVSSKKQEFTTPCI